MGHVLWHLSVPSIPLLHVKDLLIEIQYLGQVLPPYCDISHAVPDCDCRPGDISLWCRRVLLLDVDGPQYEEYYTHFSSQNPELLGELAV